MPDGHVPGTEKDQHENVLQPVGPKGNTPDGPVPVVAKAAVDYQLSVEQSSTAKSVPSKKTLRLK